MATYRTILTNKGLQLEAAAAAAGVPLILTDMAVGDGNGNPVTPSPTQTTLARERYRHALNRLVVMPDDPTTFLAELIIPADIGGFTIREVGLYTNNGDLFAVANVPNAYKPTDAEGSFGDTVIKMMFKVANASVVTIVFDPNVTVATHTWVLNNVNASTIIPGGLASQFLAKNSNADGDFKWVDPTEGVTVIVFSREETQTLAAGQTVVDLALITAEGVAVYIEGTRLRGDEFSLTGDAQITLASSHPSGTKVTAVQNEEVGSTDVLLRPLNLSDVPDKNQARLNLGLPNWLANSSINWSQLVNVPEYASRWADWSEVTNKPTSFPPSAHTHTWGQITGAPETATRWPTWNEVTSKPSLYPPSAHSHSEYVQKIGDTMTGQLTVNGADIVTTNHLISSSGYVRGSTSQLFLGNSSGAGEVYIRPNGWSSSELQAVFNNNGDLSVGGAYYSTFGALISAGANLQLATTGAGTVYIRPNGLGSSAGLVTVNNNGVLQTRPAASNPANGVTTFGVFTSGSYGGGFAMNDGGYNIGLWSNFGTLTFGFGNDNGALTARATLNASGAFNPFGGIDTGSSRKLKNIDGDMPYGLAEVRRVVTLIGRYKPEYNPDGRVRLFFDAEQLAEVIPEAVDLEGVEFNGEMVATIKLDQVMPPAYRAIAELADLVEELREEIAALKAGR